MGESKEEYPKCETCGRWVCNCPQQREQGAVLCGDINQGLGDNLIVVNVAGNGDGKGLPTAIIIRARDTGETRIFTPTQSE